MKYTSVSEKKKGEGERARDPSIHSWPLCTVTPLANPQGDICEANAKTAIHCIQNGCPGPHSAFPAANTLHLNGRQPPFTRAPSQSTVQYFSACAGHSLSSGLGSFQAVQWIRAVHAKA
ncbi:hypothetical protein ACOMHN_029457 [Nucella lapillus]